MQLNPRNMVIIKFFEINWNYSFIQYVFSKLSQKNSNRALFAKSTFIKKIHFENKFQILSHGVVFMPGSRFTWARAALRHSVTDWPITFSPTVSARRRHRILKIPTIPSSHLGTPSWELAQMARPASSMLTPTTTVRGPMLRIIHRPSAFLLVWELSEAKASNWFAINTSRLESDNLK